MIAKRVTPPSQLGLGLNLSTKKTRKREFLDEMDRVVPWSAPVQIVEPYSPRAKTGRPPFAIETMLRVHYLQQWFGLSDPAMEEALHDVPLYREFAGRVTARAVCLTRPPYCGFVIYWKPTTWPSTCCAWSTTSCRPRV
jgi:Transposase domain (DUF772)